MYILNYAQHQLILNVLRRVNQTTHWLCPTTPTTLWRATTGNSISIIQL